MADREAMKARLLCFCVLVVVMELVVKSLRLLLTFLPSCSSRKQRCVPCAALTRPFPLFLGHAGQAERRGKDGQGLAGEIRHRRG